MGSIPVGDSENFFFRIGFTRLTLYLFIYYHTFYVYLLCTTCILLFFFYFNYLFVCLFVCFCVFLWLIIFNSHLHMYQMSGAWRIKSCLNKLTVLMEKASRGFNK